MIFGPKTVPNPPLVFTATYKTVQLEFVDTEVRIFGVLRNGTVWRGDYFILNIPPLQPYDRSKLVNNYNATAFSSVEWVVPNKKLQANATIVNSLRQIWRTALIFEFDREDSNINLNGVDIKFSYIAKSSFSIFAYFRLAASRLRSN